MKITDFAELIRCMPYREQAFDVKYEIWKGTEPSKIIENIFRNKDKNGIITISRNDLFQSNSDLVEFVIKVIMWGYPTKGRGNNIDNFLKSENFESFIETLVDAKKNKHISITDINNLMKNSTGLGFSTLSKILYFSRINYETMPALIFDLRVINALSAGRFNDSGIEIFKKLRYDNALKNYNNYLRFMNLLAKKLQTEADRIEMFLFEFGSNLKELTEKSDSQKKTEKVFEILGEGSGICITRQVDKSSTKFIYHHNEFDPTNEGLDLNKKDEYDYFEQPFQLINDRYPWYLMYLETVHDDYRNYIIERLIEKLNHKSVLLDNFEYHKEDLENSLGIKLNYSANPRTNKLTWSYEKIM